MNRGLFIIATCLALTACSEPARLSPVDRADLVVPRTAFKAPPVFGYGDGLVGKRLSARSVEAEFAEASKRHFNTSNGPRRLDGVVSFPDFTAFTRSGKIFGGNVAAQASGIVEVRDPFGAVVASSFVSVSASGVAGELPGGAFRTPDQQKIARLAEKFAKRASTQNVARSA